VGKIVIKDKLSVEVEPTSLQTDMADEVRLESDVVVRMPPAKKYKVSLSIKGVKRAIPRIVEPEGRE
jgi:hypothetical protein